MSAVAPDTFSRGPGTLRVHVWDESGFQLAHTLSNGEKIHFSVSRKALHSKTREKMVEAMREVVAPESQGIVLLQGGVDRTFESTDTEILFRQESFFHYLFGVEEPNFLGAVDLRSGVATLFAPRLPQEYAVWMGPLMSRQDVGDKYAVDEVEWVEDIAKHLRAANPPQLHLLCGTNSDSGSGTTAATFEGIESFKVERELLHDVLAECRVRKLPEEIEIIEYCNLIGSQGHVKTMQASARCQMEFQLEAVFLNHCYCTGGCRHAPYTPICSSGPNSAILHYGHAGAPNSRQLTPDDMVLTDMGCEYYRYGSDITTSWPAGGRFSPRQALVYNTVLDAHHTVAAAMKPGVSWPDLHRLAQERILTRLLVGGLLKGAVSDMMRVHLAAVFMPHGLGHLLGIDTHDVGGYLPGFPPRIHEPSLRSLRTARTLEEGMVVTLEPGCYFNPVLLRPALQDASQRPFLIPEALEDFMEFGGVRLEDNIVITADGSRSLTDVPRRIEDVEAVMAGAAWPRE